MIDDENEPLSRPRKMFGPLAAAEAEAEGTLVPGDIRLSTVPSEPVAHWSGEQWVPMTPVLSSSPLSDDERLARILRRFIARNTNIAGYVGFDTDGIDLILDGKINLDRAEDRALIRRLMDEAP